MEADTPTGSQGVAQMQSFLVWSKYVTMWFSNWKTDTTIEYIFSLLAVFFLAVLYQRLTSFRTNLVSEFKAELNSENKLDDVEAGSTLKFVQKYPKTAKSVLALLFGINSAIGYLVMLAVMGFNAGVFLAVVSGVTVAYVFFEL